MKPRRKKRGGNKSFYIAAALVLLATGGIARITVDKTDKTDIPSKIDYVESSSITSAAETPITSQNENLIVNSDQATADTSESDTTTKIQNTETESEEDTKQAATAEILTFAMPIKANIIKPFSLTSLIYSETYGDMRAHDGIDILAEEGTPIKACAEGTVKEIKEDSLWGNTVIIEHKDGIFSYYCGLSDITVKEGALVNMNKIVGTVGEVPCECLDDSHLHFALKDSSGWLSPLEVMGLQ